ncbi:MAG: hypothetical protein LBJ15_19765 [Comamonas sp.]|jgi:hypothetical protein|uniref:hypothetical protein n=1 Tax=Comamonas sp. TaxID=34028 RepID=UPI0028283B62|nr:hypothetical protein [Comamonas sp.]MDR0216214.1 hypothetical protein [Comamonas sp.]
MTCHLSPIDWRDVLYNTVRKAPGGVVAAAAYLTQRRGRSIHPETLRARLRGVDGEWINLEMLELLTEWLQEMREPQAMQWLTTLNMRYGLVAMELPPPPPGGWPSEAEAIQKKLLQLGVEGGALTALGMRVTEDKVVSPPEALEMSAQIPTQQLRASWGRCMHRAGHEPQSGYAMCRRRSSWGLP